jgi:hypothetical protein
MATIELDGPDAPACPLLGLEADPRSHFTYPHPSHRCFAQKRPALTDARRQTTYCLSGDFTACDRYRASERVPESGSRTEPGRSVGGSSARGPHAVPGAAVPKTTVIYVFRAGDSLARIAAAYDLTVEQLATANGLRRNAALADGARLVIPLHPPEAGLRRARPTPKAGG